MSAPDKQDELAKVEQFIAAQEGLRGVLSEAQFEVMLRPLLEKRATLRAEVAGSGAVAQGDGAVAAGARGVAAGGGIAGSFVNTGRIEGNVYYGDAPDDPEKALGIYRRVLASSCRDVSLRGLDAGAADATGQQKGMDLAAIYVDLDTTAGTRALDAVAQHRTMVLLGDPGSGKSTVVNYITRCLAEGGAKSLPDWPQAAKELLPVVVILRDFARAHPAVEGTPDQLWKFVVTSLGKQNLGFAAKPMLAAIEAGQALVLLDGLDEVPTNAQRSLVRDAAAAFMARYPNSAYLVTCRTLSYQDPAWQLPPEVERFTLAPFNDKKIGRFIEAWYAELSRRNVVTPDKAAELSAALAEAVKRPDLARLAASPLLLTTMAIIHASESRLPDKRAQLYDRAVDLLLWRREALEKRREAAETRGVRGVRDLLDEADLSEKDLKRVLAKVAFEAHATPSKDGKVAGIEEHRIESALADIHPKGRGRDWAHDLVEAMKLRAGLLLESAPRVYTLPHRTFQEYLAGMHLMRQPDFPQRAVDLVSQGPQWREVILLAAGTLVHVVDDWDRPLVLVGELCRQRAEDTEVAWRNAWLAGEVLLEVGLQRVRGNVGLDMAERVRGRLVELVQKGRLGALERAKAGDVLAKLRDPRFEEEAWGLPREETLGFVEVPGGKFWMGSDKARDEQARGSELPLHEVALPGYWMGKYPVTVAQFRAFVEQRGMEPTLPYWAQGVANHPVVNVTWDEAMAYGEWLTERLRESPRTPEPLATLLRGTDKDGFRWRVTLPSEAQWEKAARGTDGRIYPWGDDGVDPTRANYADTGIGGTSAVGCFRAGASPYGCEEMSGNLWEWTRSRHLDYPYNAASEANDTCEGEQARRAVRGGAFLVDSWFVRCAFRNVGLPLDPFRLLGFRVVVSSYL